MRRQSRRFLSFILLLSVEGVLHASLGGLAFTTGYLISIFVLSLIHWTPPILIRKRKLSCL